ncbi:MAG: marine proteobacterial sortase target protein [Pseudomonadota bacterium]
MLTHRRLREPWHREMQRFGSVWLWLSFRCLSCAVATALALLLLNSMTLRAAEHAPDPGPAMSGSLVLYSAVGESQQAQLQATRVHFEISGLVAVVRLEQAFYNPGSHFMEGVYAFPLPEEAAVRRMELHVGERLIVGEVRERTEAERRYQVARDAGRNASLIAQQRPNLFTNRIANIAPGDAIRVTLEYVQPVQIRQGEFSLRFPSTLTPRYFPGEPLASTLDETLVFGADHGWARPTDQVRDADAVSPPQYSQPGRATRPLNPLRLSATLDMGMPLAEVDAPYHDIAMTRRAGVYHIELSQGVSEMNRDFVLRWRPVSDAMPGAAWFTERVGSDYYGVLMLVPPAAPDRSERPHREIVFVVDTSGSMGGESIEQARASLIHALTALGPRDRFNVVAFNNSVTPLYRAPVPASAEHLRRATRFVRSLRASGGTEMSAALRMALKPAAGVDELHGSLLLSQVVFMTDGAVGNEQALFAEIQSLLGDRRLFTVGIGSAPNSWFMRKSAEFGRGTYTYIGKLDEVEARIAELLSQLARPASINLRVQWPQSVEAFPNRLPDLYAGEPLALAVHFGTSLPAGEVLISGEHASGVWQRRLSLDSSTQPEGLSQRAGIASVWARRKIASLMDGRYSGLGEQALRQAVLPVALRHHLLSPYTSFVAVESAVVRTPGKPLVVRALPNTRPQGQSPQAYAYPQTATSAPAKVWLGSFALFVALLLRALRQPECDRRVSQTA